MNNQDIINKFMDKCCCHTIVSDNSNVVCRDIDGNALFVNLYHIYVSKQSILDVLDVLLNSTLDKYEPFLINWFEKRHGIKTTKINKM